jgi:hypothetical protein
MKLSKRELNILGAGLYACEGAKLRISNQGRKHYEVDFTNNNPKLINLFLRFVRECIHAPEDKIKAQLFIYPDHDETEVLNFWSSTTKIPLNRFTKVMHMVQRSGRFKPSIHGTLKVRYSHKENFLTIQSIISDVFTNGGVG